VNNDHRDMELEATLQEAIDSGNRVWVVGDIHGHIKTLEELISQIDLESGHKLISLGDMIDRGPDSASVLEIFRRNPSFCALKGNHEQMMHESISIGENRHWEPWLKYGGVETLTSLGSKREEGHIMDLEWSEFLAGLPTEIILKRFRLVHAGFDPDVSIEAQRDRDRLWSRKAFQSSTVLDNDRQIILGHTPVQEIVGHGSNSPWYSRILLGDGRPSIIGIDTGICLKRALNPTLTAIELGSGDLVQVPRLD